MWGELESVEFERDNLKSRMNHMVPGQKLIDAERHIEYVSNEKWSLERSLSQHEDEAREMWNMNKQM